MHRAARLLGIWTAIASVYPPAADAASAALTVRVYDTSEQPPAALEASITTARRTLDSTGVLTEWMDCSRPSDICRVAVGPDVLAVRIVRAPVPRGYRTQAPMGDALIDRGRRTGSFATIYADRVAWLAQAADADSRVLMGRAIAHEIGHLLLGTSVHAAQGLMRARWSAEELRRDTPNDWVFTPRDARCIRESVRLRAKTQTRHPETQISSKSQSPRQLPN